MSRGTLFIISAPSGAGKTTLIQALIARMDHVVMSVSHTTRSAREGELDGKDYHFIDQAGFEEKIRQGDFLEHARVFDNYYGTSKLAVEKQLDQGLDVILDIDWQGAQQIRTAMADTLSIFILPPSREVLAQRLRSRGKDSDEVIERRMRDAKNEISHYNEYNYLIINDDLQQASEHLVTIFSANRLSLNTQIRKQVALLDALLD